MFFPEKFSFRFLELGVLSGLMLHHSSKECSAAGVHAPPIAGIHGTKDDGAYSVVMSGDYNDDEDHGETLYVAVP